MRRTGAVLAALAFQLLAAGAALADYDSSRTWFESLPAAERADAQADLTLLGSYYYLVDGQFGTGTFNALVDFQFNNGMKKTGVLTEDDLKTLDELSGKVYADFGMELVRDEAGQVEITIPAGLLTEVKTTAEGTSYATADGGMTVETIYKASQDQSFAELYASLSKPGKGRIITSKSFNDERFLVTGHQDGRDFYLMYKNTGTGSIGYSLTWSVAYADRGNILSIYIASNFTPLSSLPPEDGVVPEKKPSGGATASLHFGAFSLPPNMPDAIALDGEVTGDFYNDFARALDARPDARIMLLNSPGGYVDSALAVAREVYRRGMTTIVGPGMGCYSACSYIFFAGQPRSAEGELGVHQISAEVEDLVMAQTTLSDVIDALNQFGVEQVVIVRMLRTPPEDMYIFSAAELTEWEINRGGPVEVADIPVQDPVIEEPADQPGDVMAAFVQLAQQSNEAEARRALDYAIDRWAGVLGGAQPEIDQAESAQGTIYRVRIPANSLESANAICSAIKSAGGGCFVTKVER